MRLKQLAMLFSVFSIAFLLFLSAPRVKAQSLTTGGITGVVTDPSGAVVPNAKVTVKSTTKGISQSTTTNGRGAYDFSFLDPGPYTITVQATGFRPTTQAVSVSVGQPVTANVPLALASAGTTVTVTEAAPLIQTANGNTATTMSETQVSQIPSPGNDMTTIAQLAPGSVENTNGMYGNFSSYGMPATSNLFTLDGMEDNDPFLNLNNSGATNLLLGQNEVQEATVVSNGYTGEYGGLAGANVNYVTKSGTNSFHGDANYFYNGRVLNANDFFNNASGNPRPFDIANQWGADIGGPILRNKLWFYADVEGLKVTLPTSETVNVPTQAFETAVLANVAPLGSQATSFYNSIFKLYNSAPGASGAQDILPPGQTAAGAATGDGCSNYGGLGTAPCALAFQSNASNSTHEWMLAGRGDYSFSANDRAFVRLQMDRGTQATFTDPINSIFDAISVQPEEQGQIEETHTFGGSMVNQFIASGAYYSAIFAPLNLGASLAVFPTDLGFDDGSLQNVGGGLADWPQGRNVTQMQFSDDLSKTMGRHTLKFGAVFRRNDVSDHDNGILSSGALNMLTLNDFANGGVTGDTFTQRFASSTDLPIDIYNMGLYAQDEWRVKDNFTLTLALRAEHFSNPVCETSCFGRFVDPFNQLNHSVAVPYNQALATGQSQALSGFIPVVWEPRMGFAWQPFGSARSMVVRGGIGIFADEFPATVADNFSGNPPLLNGFTVGNDYGVPCPSSASGCTPTNIFADAANSNKAFLSGFAAGDTLAQIEASDPAFVPPGVAASDKQSHVPTYYKWSLGIQQGIGSKTVLAINYEGNHGIYEVVQNSSVNAYCPPSACALGFAGLPAVAPDPRFGTVSVFTNAGVSNYNGVTLSATHRYSSGLIQANYTWSHSFDDVSNAGILPFSTTAYANQDPNNIAGAYGPSDYDVRQYLSVDGVYMLPFKRLMMGRGPNWFANGVLDGWQISGEMFARTGMPFSVIDGNDSGALSADNYGGTLFANFSGTSIPSCGMGAATFNGTPCLSASEFSPAINAAGAGAFGNSSRNEFRGPGYTDMDLSLMKYTNIPHTERMRLGIGAQAYNVFNHPNFATPINNMSSTAFGRILSAVGPPTSVLGSFLGGDASPRLLQITAKLTF